VDYKFQINLRGIIDLLSNHLYSSPQVYLRELLQNGVDAIRARTYVEPGHEGEITLELLGGSRGTAPTLMFADNGIGLTEEEIHRFLATIGETSKRGDHWDRPTDFLGQFGIGLLSCFVVSDEIVVVTRSARSGPTMEWRGRPDGTYTVKTLPRELAPGTQLYLTCKPGHEEYFEAERVKELVLHFGSLLPFPIRLTAGKGSEVLNDEPVPWRQKFASDDRRRKALLACGRKMFDMDFFDCIPLHSGAGEVDGVAFVLPFSPNLATRPTHRVYLKNMLLSEDAENLLPDWAFFVKCVVNANNLRPTASRESFYEDEALAETREQLGQCLRDYLVHLARREPERLQQLIALHYLTIKALALQDDEFYRIFIDWLPFETSMGPLTLGECRKQHGVIRYVEKVDHFRQIAGVAAAQSMCILNGGYTYDSELLEKFGSIFPEEQVELVDPAGLTQTFDELTLAEQEQMFGLLRTADVVLQPFRCAADCKKFRPPELPAMYTTTRDANFLRAVEQSKEVADPLWGGVLDNLAGKTPNHYAQLCFNGHNPLVRKLAQVKNGPLLQRAVQMLYIQALLMGHHPLSAREMKLLNTGLIGLIELGVNAAGEPGADVPG
jgi:molecular chaperone HtpG